MTRWIAALTLMLTLFPISLAQAQDCRDPRGEPIACPAPIAAPPSEPPPERARREREQGYVNFFPQFDLADPSGVRFTPDSPSTVPEIERGAHLTNVGSGFDHVFGGFTFGVGYRPVPWLRLPDVQLAWGYSDFGGRQVGLEGGAQSLTGTMRDVWMVRAQLAAGLDLDLSPIRLYALGHVGVGGYFAQVEVAGSSIGGLGTHTYSALSLEAGWTVGMEIEIADGLAYTLGYRHVHTGVEQNTFFVGINGRFE
jgi:hypothetical protein